MKSIQNEPHGFKKILKEKKIKRLHDQYDNTSGLMHM